jgi:hypothetical protein
MKASEAIQALELGKKVRYRVWGSNEFVRVDQGGVLVDEDGHYSTLEISDYLTNLWELYEEPGHDWNWAKQQLRAGNKVHRKSWGGWYLYYVSREDIVYCEYVDKREPTTEKWISLEEEDATDWILA